MTDSSANPRKYGERPLHEDDPLMELSRIVDFGAPAGNAAAWNERQSHNPVGDERTEPGFDLERELFGNFDDFAPVKPDERTAESVALDDEFASVLEDELDFRHESPADAPASEPVEPELAGFEDAERSEPVPQFNYADYSDARDAYGNRYETEPSDHDALAYETRESLGTVYSSRGVDEPVAHVQPASLEDELESLLFGDELESAAPAAVTRNEPSTYPYYPRGNFASGVVAQMPLSPASVQSSPVETVADFAFDTRDTRADTAAEATDDDLSDLDALSLSDEDFGFETSGDLADVDDDAIGEADFFNEDDLDLSLEGDDDTVSPDYAHAMHSDEEYRPSAEQPYYANPRQAVSAPVPEVETLSVSENKVEQTHSLDLPEVDYGEEENAAGLGDLEAEFAEVFNTVGIDESGAASDAQSEADKAFEDIFRESASSYLPSAGTAAAGAALGLGAAAVYGQSQSLGVNRHTAADPVGNADDFYNHWATQGQQSAASGDYDARMAMPAEDDLGQAAEAYRNRPVRGRRGLILASVAGAVVLLGGIGYHFLGGGTQEPVVIHADSQPTKMAPENPGGVTVPNQDKAVYDRVAGTLPNNPEQKSLITSGEEPVNISGTDDSEDTAGDTSSQDGTGAPEPTAPANADQNAPLVQPREVETMIVRSDGTIMNPAETQPSASSAETQPSAPAGGDEIGAIASGNVAPEATAPAPQPETPAPVAEAPRAPIRAPVVPSRPAEQPVNIVGNVPQRTQTQAPQAAAPAANQQVASAATSTAGAGGYFIQIASQPSAELAQKSYASMAQKYANVIGGRGVDIKRADIAGKGTYYRVRVQAGSRDDANALCSRLKSAGGSCLVTR